jgi:hypothetical protein
MYVVIVKWKPAHAKECNSKDTCTYSFKDKDMAKFHFDAWSNSKHVSKVTFK